MTANRARVVVAWPSGPLTICNRLERQLGRPRSNPQYGARPDDSWRNANIGRVLFTAANLFEQDLLEFLRMAGYPEIRLADLVLYRSLDGSGTRLTELAARALMTKQGVKELIDQAEKQGFVTRIPSEHDRRAKIVSFTPRGREMLEVLHAGIVRAERAMAELVGEERFRSAADTLVAFLHARGMTSVLAREPSIDLREELSS